eukprot:12494318-Heterocapsa_arctica.AAC.1
MAVEPMEPEQQEGLQPEKELTEKEKEAYAKAMEWAATEAGKEEMRSMPADPRSPSPSPSAKENRREANKQQGGAGEPGRRNAGFPANPNGLGRDHEA